MNRTIFQRLVFGMIAALALMMCALFLIQRAQMKQSCERAVATREELAGFLSDASDARRDTGDRATADVYERREHRVRRQIVNCDEKYPLVPFA